MLTRLSVVVLMSAGLAVAAAVPEDFQKAIREGDLAAVKQLAADRVAVNQADKRGNTPLHYAALLGGPEAVKLILAAGGSVKAANVMGATPLHLAASSVEKLRLLLAAGAEANAATKMGRTPLMLVAGRAGMTSVVKQLLDAGADPNASDGVKGETPLIIAATSGELETVKLLISRGAQPDKADKGAGTPMLFAAGDSPERIGVFLNAKANVNVRNQFAGMVRKGPVGLTQLSPLILASAHGDAQMVTSLLKAGAEVNTKDGRGMTPLMAAVSSETQDAGVIRALIAAGADVNADDGKGEKVLDWARKYNNPATLKLLVDAGAKGGKVPAPPARSASKPPATPAAAVDQALTLLTASRRQFFAESGCVGCHHQPVISKAMKAAGRKVETADSQAGFQSSRAMEPMWLQLVDTGGDVDTVAMSLGAFATEGIPSDSLTDAAVNYLAARQQADGSWRARGISRAPFEDSDITRTAAAVRAMRAYAWPGRQAELDERVAQAKSWLLRAKLHNNAERADQLSGLVAAGAGAADLVRLAAELLKQQRADGGWNTSPYLESDAYGTGLAMHALLESGQLKVTDAAWQRGRDYLLKTQLDDGSWYVRSRAPKFLPYFESGFPHGHDQWISSAATAYAVMALAPAAR